MQTLEERVQKIEERNRGVETDKEWETSFMRRGLLMIFTYLTVAIYLNYIGVENPWINAIVPALGFMISTLSMPFFKKLWIKFRK